jgi:protein tyrosine phosphatase (PTP) superfamily phosphohydrolase (DUF442 family)
LHVASSGTTSPIAATAVFGNTATTYGLSDTVVGANLMFAGTGRYNGWLTYYPSRADGKPYFRMESSSSAYADSPVGLLVSGNVGIGTTTPGAKLEIAGVAGTDGIKFPDGTIQTSARPNAEMAVADFQAMGTTYTTVPRFGTTVIGQTASDFTYASSTANGASFTINKSGTYFVALWGFCDWAVNQGLTASIGKNVTAAPALNSSNLLATDVCYTTSSYLHAYASAVVYLSAGDVVRPFYSTTPPNNSGRFEIRRIN